ARATDLVCPGPIVSLPRLASWAGAAIGSALQPWLIAIGTFVASSVEADTDDGTAFFESRIRPVLLESCYPCHSSQAKSPKGGLRVDSRGALMRGGENGPAIVPGRPADSRLFQALSHDSDVVGMPPKGRLPDRVLADFHRW